MKDSERDQWAEWFDKRQAGLPAKPIEQYKTRTPKQLEHEIQKTFIDWCALARGQYPELDLIYAIPNGGHRHPAVAGKLKAEGVKAGMPDLHLPVPRGTWASLYLEVKAPGEKAKAYQVERMAELRAAGNFTAVCDGLQKLINTVLAYLKGEIKDG